MVANYTWYNDQSLNFPGNLDHTHKKQSLTHFANIFVINLHIWAISGFLNCLRKAQKSGKSPAPNPIAKVENLLTDLAKRSCYDRGLSWPMVLQSESFQSIWSVNLDEVEGTEDGWNPPWRNRHNH